MYHESVHIAGRRFWGEDLKKGLPGLHFENQQISAGLASQTIDFISKPETDSFVFFSSRFVFLEYADSSDQRDFFFSVYSL